MARPLTATNIKYLLTLRELEKTDSGVRCIDLASRLKVSKPSVHTMVDTLMELGLVEKEKYGSVFFTALGREKAEKYAGSFDAVYASLSRSLSLSDEDCRDTAYDILAKTPEAELPSIAERLGISPCRGCCRLIDKA